MSTKVLSKRNPVIKKKFLNHSLWPLKFTTETIAFKVTENGWLVVVSLSFPCLPSFIINPKREWTKNLIHGLRCCVGRGDILRAAFTSELSEVDWLLLRG